MHAHEYTHKNRLYCYHRVLLLWYCVCWQLFPLVIEPVIRMIIPSSIIKYLRHNTRVCDIMDNIWLIFSVSTANMVYHKNVMQELIKKQNKYIFISTLLMITPRFTLRIVSHSKLNNHITDSSSALPPTHEFNRPLVGFVWVYFDYFTFLSPFS